VSPFYISMKNIVSNYYISIEYSPNTLMMIDYGYYLM